MHARMLPSKPKAWPSWTTKSLKLGFSRIEVQRSSVVQPAGPVGDRDAAHAGASGHPAAADQHVAVRGQGRLHDAARPRVLPEQRAVGRRDAGRAGAAEHQDLRDAVDRRQVRRAVAAAGRAEPARLAGGEVVGDERAGVDDDQVVDHQGRAREAPARDLGAGVGRRVARPHDAAVTGVEHVQDSGRAERVETPVARVGVARGPAPACGSQNRAASRCLHTGSPVAAS